MPGNTEWNRFVSSHSSPASFLQSWEWGEFQRELGNQVYRIGDGSSWAAQIVAKKFPAGKSYLEVAKGPIIGEMADSRRHIGEFEKRIREIAKQENAVMARINPPYARSQFNFGPEWRKPAILVRQLEPENTVLVDLTKSEEELMENMHEKSRYNIRLAQKKGVKVELMTESDAAFEQFLILLEGTAKRDGIISWPRERFLQFRQIFMTSSAEPRAELLVGSLNGRVLAAAIVMLFGDSGTYLYAASSAQDRSANVPSLVLWEAIKLAKTRGKKWYDMWGVAPENEPNHPWAGITRFKTRYIKPGVTGKAITGAGARDLVLDKTFYSLFRIYKLFHG